jgi:hypothetical protein
LGQQVQDGFILFCHDIPLFGLTAELSGGNV